MPDLSRRARNPVSVRGASPASLWDLLAEHHRLMRVWALSRAERDRLAMAAWWQIGITEPGSSFGRVDEIVAGAWARCTPTLLERVASPGGRMEYRGACLGCGWVAESSRRGQGAGNEAVEDAHDHSHLGWRALPVVGGLPFFDAAASYERRLARWLQTWEPLLPPGWLEAGGPIRTHRTSPGNRHVPGRAPGGGYDLATDDPEERGGQLGLF